MLTALPVLNTWKSTSYCENEQINTECAAKKESEIDKIDTDRNVSYIHLSMAGRLYYHLAKYAFPV
jgi:hypothetical protein